MLQVDAPNALDEGAGLKLKPLTAALRALSIRADFAYLSILLIQLRRIWGLWLYRDLTGGDTSSYFEFARRWVDHFQTDVVWSPLYTIYYGTLLFVQPDAARATMLHRVLIVLAAAAMVLAVARRMLPKPLAWLVALWWVMLPVHFDPMYEVHLFALLPILLCWWILAGPPSAWRRGAGLGVLLLSALLVRNEYIVAFAILALTLLLYERRHAGRNAWRAYAIPTGAVCLCFVWVCLRTTGGLPEIRQEMRVKHGINMAQVYSYGYAQRHPEWQADPWTDYQRLAMRDFGVAQPSIALMARRNPVALLKHLAWNVRLLPGGLQIILFGASSGSVNPDYAQVPLHRSYAMVLSLVLLGISIAGAIAMWRERRFWKRAWLGKRVVAWIAMASVMLVMPLVIATQRPRAEYLSPLGIVLMMVAALCGWMLIARWPRVRRNLALLPPIFAVAALCMPHFYVRGSSRPLREHYEVLRPFQATLMRPETTFLSDDGGELERYLGHSQSEFCDYSIFSAMPPSESIADFLKSRGINLIDLAPHDQVELRRRLPGKLEEFEATAPLAGWKLVANRHMPGGRWLVYVRQ